MSGIQDLILNILKDGNFHSGESLGESLGCSRTAVWKQVQKLESLGLSVETVKGTGYRVRNGFELLDEEEIQRHLSAMDAIKPVKIEIFKTIDSTSKYARELAERNSLSGGVVLAEQQSAGRGRRGKTWISPFAANIYLSMVWDFEYGAQALEGLSLAVGVAVKRALNTYGVTGIQLKWPNDIYIQGKKLGGILLEMIGDPAGHCSVIVGVGINVAMPLEQGENIEQKWTDVRAQMKIQGVTQIQISRNYLAAELIHSLTQLLYDFQERGFSFYRDEWQAADAFYGLKAAISTPKHSIHGIVKGVDNNGALKLLLEDGKIETFIGGELSLRLSE